MTATSFSPNCFVKVSLTPCWTTCVTIMSPSLQSFLLLSLFRKPHPSLLSLQIHLFPQHTLPPAMILTHSLGLIAPFHLPPSCLLYPLNHPLSRSNHCSSTLGSPLPLPHLLSMIVPPSPRTLLPPFSLSEDVVLLLAHLPPTLLATSSCHAIVTHPPPLLALLVALAGQILLVGSVDSSPTPK